MKIYNLFVENSFLFCVFVAVATVFAVSVIFLVLYGVVSAIFAGSAGIMLPGLFLGGYLCKVVLG